MKTEVNKNDSFQYGKYTFKGEDYPFCVAKKFVDVNGNIVVGAPFGTSHGLIYMVYLPYSNYKKWADCLTGKSTEAVSFKPMPLRVDIRSIAEIKIIKLPEIIRNTLEEASKRVKDKALNITKEMNSNKPVENKPVEKAEVATPKAKKVVTDNTPKIQDRLYSDEVKTLATAIHKVFDNRLAEITPKSLSDKYEVLSPYKVAVLESIAPATPSDTGRSCVVYFYTLVRITDPLEILLNTLVGANAYEEAHKLGISEGYEDSDIGIGDEQLKITKILSPTIKTKDEDDSDKSYVNSEQYIEPCLRPDKLKEYEKPVYAYPIGLIFTKADTSYSEDFCEISKWLPIDGGIAGTNFAVVIPVGTSTSDIMDWTVNTLSKEIIKNNKNMFNSSKE